MKACRDRGHRMLLCAPENTQIYRKCCDEGFPVFAFTDARLKYPSTILRLKKFFQREQVDVVNTHSSRDGWLAGIAAHLAGVPLLIRSRHIEVDYPNRFLSHIAFRTLPHHVITTSEKISNRLIRELHLPARKVTCIATGIDLSRFNPQIPGRLREELNLAPGTLMVGMVSVLRSWKGHRFFLGAAREILDQRQDVHFVIAGEGDGRAEISALIHELDLKGHVTLLGHREDVPNVLASLDVLVLPSTAHEGIPQIILQAQAMGKAVVGTTVGGIPEVVRDNETGLLAPPRDGVLLAEKIGQLLESKELRTRLGTQALAVAQADYSLEAMCRRLDCVYEKRLGEFSRTKR